MTTPIERPAGVVDIIHGVEVHDPYRWLEDRNHPATEQWIADQRVRFEDYFATLGPLDNLKARIRGYLDVETVDQVARVQDLYFYRKRKMGDQQSAIYVRHVAEKSERLLIDPRGMGSFASVGIYRISSDATLLAYELKRGGEHAKAIHVLDVRTGAAWSKHLERGLARGFAFHESGRGFYYTHDSCEAAEGADHVISFHDHGLSLEADATIFRAARHKGSKLVFHSFDGNLLATYYHVNQGTIVADCYRAHEDSTTEWTSLYANRSLPFYPFIHRDRLLAYRADVGSNGEIVELTDVGHGSIKETLHKFDLHSLIE